MTYSTYKVSFLLRAAGAACAFLLASALPAQTPDYFPLEAGNTWLYKAVTIVGTRPVGLNITYQTVRVTGTETIGGRQYFDVSYFGRDVVLRKDAPTGDVFLYDRAAGTEVPWVLLSLPVSGTFSSGLDPCSMQGQIVSRDSTVAVQAGDFANTIQVDFHGNCADAGVTRQYYSPNVGLIRQEENSFAGPLNYLLIYYRAGSRLGASEVSFTVAVDSPSYFEGTLLGARVTLRNTATGALSLHFPSSQSFDFKILNDKGEAVYVWSSDKSFAAVARDEKLGPGELTYGATVPLVGLPAGHYVMQAYLATDPAVYWGQVAFDVVALPGRQ